MVLVTPDPFHGLPSQEIYSLVKECEAQLGAVERLKGSAPGSTLSFQ